MTADLTVYALLFLTAFSLTFIPVHCMSINLLKANKKHIVVF